jgi:hypothetical protein
MAGNCTRRISTSLASSRFLPEADENEIDENEILENEALACVRTSVPMIIRLIRRHQASREFCD